MSDKKTIIREMIEMQRKFIEFDREKGVTQEEYWASEEDHPLHGYKERFDEMATKLVDMAHEEQGSKR